MPKPMENLVCPLWAEEQIEYLRRAEVFRGTIPDKPNWKDESVEALAGRISGEDLPVFDEDKIDFLFKRIATRLAEESYTATEIAYLINDRIKLIYGPKYCSSEEVQANLKKA